MSEQQETAEAKPAKSSLSSLKAIELLLARCQAHERRLDSLKGRKRLAGRNPNVVVEHHLGEALEAMRELEYELKVYKLYDNEHQLPIERPEQPKQEGDESTGSVPSCDAEPADGTEAESAEVAS